MIYSIFAKPLKILEADFYLEQTLAAGQNALDHISTATGGKAFYSGLAPDPAFQPYLQEIQENLEHQYLLTFQAAPGQKPGFVPLRISTTNKSLQLRYQARVYVPAAK